MAFCKNLPTKIKKLYKKLDAAIVKFLPLIDKVIVGLKLILDSEFVKDLVDLTPATWDNVLREQFVTVLECALREFAIVTRNLNADGTINIMAVVIELAKLPKADKDSFYFKLSGLMLKYLHEKKLTQSDYDFFIQSNFSIQKVV